MQIGCTYVYIVFFDGGGVDRYIYIYIFKYLYVYIYSNIIYIFIYIIYIYTETNCWGGSKS